MMRGRRPDVRSLCQAAAGWLREREQHTERERDRDPCGDGTLNPIAAEPFQQPTRVVAAFK
jgi:hypothetical protein